MSVSAELQAKKAEPTMFRSTEYNLNQLQLSKKYPDLKDDLSFTRNLTQTLKKNKDKVASDKSIKPDIAMSLIKLLEIYFEKKDCSRIFGDELAHEKVVTVLLDYMEILTDSGTDYPLNDSDPEKKYNYCCFLIIRYLFWGYTRDSPSVCLEVGRNGFFTILLRDLQRFLETFNIDKKRLSIVESALSILYNCAGLSENIKNFKNTDAIPILEWYAKNSKLEKQDELAFKGMITLSCIVAKENNDLILADRWMINTLLQIIADRVNQQKSMMEDCTTTELLQCITCLAKNESNSHMILKGGILESLVQLMDKGNPQERVSALNAVWYLSLCKKNISTVQSTAGIMKKLKSFAKSTDEKKLSTVANGALQVLERMKPGHVDDMESTHQGETSDEQEENPTAQTTKTGHVMLSYSWDNQQIMLKLNQRLQASHVKTWIDLDNMAGSVLEEMASAVENSDAVVIAISKKYKNSISCRTVAEYAYQRKVPIIPIMVEQGYRPDGWLGAILGPKMYYNFSTEETMEQNFSAFLKELGTRGKMKESTLPSQSVVSSQSQDGISDNMNKTLKKRSIEAILELNTLVQEKRKRELTACVRNRLGSLGYRVWMDLEEMSGSILGSMARGVEKSSVILICQSEKYKESFNCNTEGEYVYKQRKTIIPIRVEDGYVADEWLGALVGNKKYFDFSSDSKVEEHFPEFLEELKKKLKESK